MHRYGLEAISPATEQFRCVREAESDISNQGRGIQNHRRGLPLSMTQQRSSPDMESPRSSSEDTEGQHIRGALIHRPVPQRVYISRRNLRQARRKGRQQMIADQLKRKPRLWLERYPVTLLL